MIYHLSNDLDRQQIKIKLDHLINNGKVVELTEKKKKRSISQNSYLHLILSVYAIETGMDLEYVKQTVFKAIVNPVIFKAEATNKITGEICEYYCSSASLNTHEMTVCIDRFRNHASHELGIYLPEPSDLAAIAQMEREISRNQQYL